MKIQILFTNNPTPLILEVRKDVYNDIFKGVLEKNNAKFLWALDSRGAGTFLLLTANVLAMSILDPSDKEDEEEEEEEIKTVDYSQLASYMDVSKLPPMPPEKSKKKS